MLCLALLQPRAGGQVTSSDGMFLLGSFRVNGGPTATASAPYATAYSCVEACALLFTADLTAGG